VRVAGAIGLKYTKIGRHFGKNRFMKVGGWHGEAFNCFICPAKDDFGVVLTLPRAISPVQPTADSDHQCVNATALAAALVALEIVPEVLLNESLHCTDKSRIRTIRESRRTFIAPEFRPDPALVHQLG